MPRGSRPGERRGGRAKGTPNKKTAVAHEVRKGVAERIQEQVSALELKVLAGAAPELALDDLMRQGNARLLELIPKGTPLVYMLEIMHDERQPPTFRAEMAKAAAAYLHSKIGEQPAREQEVNQITEIRHVIVQHDPAKHTAGTGLPSAPWSEPI